MRHEMYETIRLTRETVTDSRALMEEIDRMLARRK
jgi:hypothetical protein